MYESLLCIEIVDRANLFTSSLFIVHVCTIRPDNAWLIASWQIRDHDTSLYSISTYS